MLFEGRYYQFPFDLNLRGFGAAPWPDDFRGKSYLWAGLRSGPDVPCPFDGYDGLSP
jgi:hypothetical protein